MYGLGLGPILTDDSGVFINSPVLIAQHFLNPEMQNIKQKYHFSFSLKRVLRHFGTIEQLKNKETDFGFDCNWLVNHHTSYIKENEISVSGVKRTPIVFLFTDNDDLFATKNFGTPQNAELLACTYFPEVCPFAMNGQRIFLVVVNVKNIVLNSAIETIFDNVPNLHKPTRQRILYLGHFLSVILHEVVHILQHMSNRLQVSSDADITFDGVRYPINTTIPYDQLPFEKEAVEYTRHHINTFFDSVWSHVMKEVLIKDSQSLSMEVSMDTYEKITNIYKTK